MMIIDANDERALKPGSTAQRPSLSASSSSSNSVIPPPLPEKPSKLISEEDYEPVSKNRSGQVRLSCGQIAQRHNHYPHKSSPKAKKQENPNEIIVGLHANIDEHVARAANLLEVRALPDLTR